MRKSKIPWRRSQQETIGEIGGEEVPGGGVSPGYGGDGKIRDGEGKSTHLIEHKFSTKNTISIKAEWLSKLLREATLANCEPVFTCEFGEKKNIKYRGDALIEGALAPFAVSHKKSFLLTGDAPPLFYVCFHPSILWKFQKI